MGRSSARRASGRITVARTVCCRLVGSACFARARTGLPAPGPVASKCLHALAAKPVLLVGPGFTGYKVRS